VTAGSEVRDLWIHAVLLGVSALQPGLSVIEPFHGHVGEPEPGDEPEQTREPVPA
jgi:hypothetical protein